MQTNIDEMRAAASRELLSGAEFLEMLRKVVDYRQHAKVNDPLQATVDQIRSNPAFSQSRLLMRILVALTFGHGEFRRAEVSSLDATTLALVIALMNTHAAGTRPAEDWTRAIETAKAAGA